MQSDSAVKHNSVSLTSELRKWWREQRVHSSRLSTARMLGRIGCEFIRESTPEQKRRRFGDADYDWQHRVNTTSANVSWRSRLIGLLNTSYQPIELDLFQEMLNRLGIDYGEFTFVDIGSGKGRALLMASEYPFRKVIGVELLPELDHIAQENIRAFPRERQRCSAIESVQGDATEFSFPGEPLVVFLFNPLPENGIRKVVQNLGRSVVEQRRPVWLIYANPVYEHVVLESGAFHKVFGAPQYSIYQAA